MSAFFNSQLEHSGPRRRNNLEEIREHRDRARRLHGRRNRAVTLKYKLESIIQLLDQNEGRALRRWQRTPSTRMAAPPLSHRTPRHAAQIPLEEEDCTVKV